MNSRVCILDYGSGNVKSVTNLLASLKVEHEVSNERSSVSGATHLILPGVGAFGEAMQRIRELIPLDTLRHAVFEQRKPFLGICVGMQVLAETGEEFGTHAGLGWIPARVRRFMDAGLPIPHIGWNEVTASGSSALLGDHKSLDFYFLHSFVMELVDSAHGEATTTYGETFPSIVRHGNIMGVQFHPEKSQKAGMLLINNFLML